VQQPGPIAGQDALPGERLPKGSPPGHRFHVLIPIISEISKDQPKLHSLLICGGGIPLPATVKMSAFIYQGSPSCQELPVIDYLP